MQTTCQQETLEQNQHLNGAVKAGAGLALAAGVGAGLMYFFDPNRGRARRAMCRDKAAKLYRETVHEAERTIEDLEHRAEGAMHEAEAFVHATDPVEDHILIARVRAKLGRVAAHPHRVEVKAAKGHVTLAGQVQAGEAARVMIAARLVPGVVEVDNQLETVVKANGLAKGFPRALAEIAALAGVSTILLSKPR